MPNERTYTLEEMLTAIKGALDGTKREYPESITDLIRQRDSATRQSEIHYKNYRHKFDECERLREENRMLRRQLDKNNSQELTDAVNRYEDLRAKIAQALDIDDDEG